jgi:hypothetical protein
MAYHRYLLYLLQITVLALSGRVIFIYGEVFEVVDSATQIELYKTIY